MNICPLLFLEDVKTESVFFPNNKFLFLLMYICYAIFGFMSTDGGSGLGGKGDCGVWYCGLSTCLATYPTSGTYLPNIVHNVLLCVGSDVHILSHLLFLAGFFYFLFGTAPPTFLCLLQYVFLVVLVAFSFSAKWRLSALPFS